MGVAVRAAHLREGEGVTERSLHPEPDHDAPDIQHLIEDMHREHMERGSERLLAAIEAPRLHECPKCLGGHEVPGICWRCRL